MNCNGPGWPKKGQDLERTVQVIMSNLESPAVFKGQAGECDQQQHDRY